MAQKHTRKTRDYYEKRTESVIFTNYLELRWLLVLQVLSSCAGWRDMTIAVLGHPVIRGCVIT